jgi:ketosteroid isomerase-like protein
METVAIGVAMADIRSGNALAAVERLVAATNAHDLVALADCFSPAYTNVTPAHPQRSFQGTDQVRRNWGTIFESVPDIVVKLIDHVLDGERIWTEWEMRGTRVDGSPFGMAGVIVFRVEGNRFVSARFFLEPVETVSGDQDAVLTRLRAGGRP